jgi:hypothetical protein
MLLVIVGAGASYDSSPDRPAGLSTPEPYRLPLADQLFDARESFKAMLRDIPRVMQIVPKLLHRLPGESVEDVLQVYASQIPEYPDREMQLAAVRFYIQGIIRHCEDRWYRNANQVATNLMGLVDEIERARRGRERPILVTFNYDRLIENALENRGRVFAAIRDYILPDTTPVIKLHGSVDWARRLERIDTARFGGTAWRIAQQISDEIHNLPKPGPIERVPGEAPSSLIDGYLAIPAIAIPLKDKSEFECPEDHMDVLRSAVPKVTTMLMVGWRGAEEHFLRLLQKCGIKPVDGICVGSGTGSAEQTTGNLSRYGFGNSFEAYNGGFTNFLAERKLERLLNITWRD